MKKWFYLIIVLIVLALSGIFLVKKFTGAVVIGDCESISNPSLRETCYAELGISRQSLRVCDSAGSSKFYCYERVAEVSTDVDICNKISDKYWLDICLRHFAVNSSDERLCYKIENPINRDKCFFETAVSGENELVCNLVSDVLKQARCLNGLVKIKQDPNICSMYKRDLSKYKCYYDLAKSLDDKSLCEKIDVKAIKDDCLESLPVVAS